MFNFNVNKRKKGQISGMEIEDYILTATEKEASHMEKPLKRSWANFFWWLILMLLVILSGRVFFLTVIKGFHYQEVAKGNSIRSLVIKAPRGRIFDRHGTPLVNNVPSMDIVAVPADIPKDEDRKREVMKEISDIFNLEEAAIFSIVEKESYKSLSPVLIKENVSQEEMLVFLEKNENLPGFRVQNTAIRGYVDSTIFSHILGYEGKIKKEELEKNPGYLLTDYIGKQGIEKSYESDLRGTHGAYQMEVDSLGDPKREVGIINPKPGNDLILSIDAALQKRIYDNLDRVLQDEETRTASAVALNPRNGEILALINFPSFDNNIFARGISQEQYLKLANDSAKPLFNRAIAGEYAPGSTVKPVLAAGGLLEGNVNEKTTVNSTGAISVGSYKFRDWKAHGVTDIRKAIAESCDVYFYAMGGGYGDIEGLGIERMKKYYNIFGYGKKTGIDLLGESSGHIPDENWKLDTLGERWFIGNSYHASIGQGFITATPIQVANSIAAIANGGTLYRPHLVSSIKNTDGSVEHIEPEVINNTGVTRDVIEIVQEGMRQTVTDGTAQQLKDLEVEVAGKTGTAQFGTGDDTHAWFVSYAPYENPEIVMVVLVEGGEEGSSNVVPVTKEVYRWYFSEER